MSTTVIKNNVLDVNPAEVGIKITSHGSDWLWTVFALLATSLLIHGFFVFYYENKQNFFKHYLHIGPLISSFTLAFAYFSLASNLGWAGVKTEFNHIETGDNYRQIFYARFIGWFCAWPGVLFLFELNAQAQNVLHSLEVSPLIHNVLIPIIAWEALVVSLLIGAVISSSYKWGYWTFASVAILFGLFRVVKRQLFGANAVKTFPTKLSVCFLTITSLLYPVSWALSEGGNVIQPDSEAVFYGILDLVNFLIIPFVLIYDSVKNGSVDEEPANKDTEKGVALPEARVSGETA
jgi:bacteriorhodopsin